MPKTPSKSTMETAANNIRKSRRGWRFWLRMGERLLAVVGLYFIIYHTCFRVYVISSPSMAPTLRGVSMETGDWVLTEKISLWFRNPHRWEVVQFHDAEGTIIMKRVIGLPGETVAFPKNDFLINGQALERPVLLKTNKYYAYGNLAAGRSAQCGGGFYVLGDNSVDSQDSRYEGPVPPGRIEGRAWCVIWPLEHFGWVNR